MKVVDVVVYNQSFENPVNRLPFDVKLITLVSARWR
jgi:hypothetical protein